MINLNKTVLSMDMNTQVHFKSMSRRHDIKTNHFRAAGGIFCTFFAIYLKHRSRIIL